MSPSRLWGGTWFDVTDEWEKFGKSFYGQGVESVFEDGAV